MKCSIILRLLAHLNLVVLVSMATLDNRKNGNGNIVEMDLQMDGFRPIQDDQYVCRSFEMPKNNQYIVQYKALAEAGTAHHILLFGCNIPFSTQKYWNCGSPCNDTDNIIYAWAKNAPPLKLPKDVAFHVGGTSSLTHLVMQIHYAHKFKDSEPDDHSGIKLYMTEEQPKFKAGIYLLLVYNLIIPPNTPVVHGDTSCEFQADEEIFPFGYRTHAHGLGVVISGYQFNDSWHQIGKGNPQWPQSFYPVTEDIDIKPGDFLAARCTFNSTGRNRTTYIGSTGADEMCNFYIMYYTGVNNKLPSNLCMGNNVFYPPIMQNMPVDSDTPLKPNPLLEEMANGHHHHHGMAGDPTEPQPEPIPNTFKPPHKASNQHELPPTLTETVPTNGLNFVSEWPKLDLSLGQVAGVAVDKMGNLYIFHRGANVWNSQSFDWQNVFQQQQAPIQTDPIIVVNRGGEIIRKFGKNRFFLPHGIAVDGDLNVWVTDVALHQLFRFPKDSDEPDLVLGTKFVPGNDDSHFCKPTDVAILSSGDFFLSDGYCNRRVIKFNKQGEIIQQFGASEIDFPDQSQKKFDVPHSLALAEDRGLLCVADRENWRILCFNLDGQLVREISPPGFGRVYAIEYCPQHGGVLFVVTIVGSSRALGYTIEVDTGKVRATWNSPQGLEMPHDVTVDSKEHIVYVAELSPHEVLKFTMPVTNSTSPVKTTPEPKYKTIAVAKTTAEPKSKTIAVEKVGSKPDTVADEDAGNITSVMKNLESEEDDLAPSLIIGALLVIPVVLLVIITVMVRLRITAQLPCFNEGRRKQKFNLGNFLHSHKGFNRLSTEESDHEIDPLNDSDQEEYTAPRKA